MVTAAEAQEWEVRDVESLREQYALTLDHWVRRLELEHGRAVDLVGETTYRVWRLYLAASAYWFRKGRLNVYQVLCAKPSDGRSSLPLTRKDWYGPLASDKAHEHMSGRRRSDPWVLQRESSFIRQIVARSIAESGRQHVADHCAGGAVTVDTIRSNSSRQRSNRVGVSG